MSQDRRDKMAFLGQSVCTGKMATALHGMRNSSLSQRQPDWRCALVRNRDRDRSTDPVESAKTRVRQWLQEEGWTVEEQRVPDAQWLFVARSHRAIILVGQMPEAKDQIIIRLELRFANADRFALLPLEKRRIIIHEIGTFLLLTGIDWHGLTVEPTEIMLVNYIYYDGLTKDNFVRRVGTVVSASILVRGNIALIMGESPEISSSAPEQTH